MNDECKKMRINARRPLSASTLGMDPDEPLINAISMHVWPVIRLKLAPQAKKNHTHSLSFRNSACATALQQNFLSFLPIIVS
jgi:hypothetical protein